MSAKFNPGLQSGGGHRKIGEIQLDGDILPERRVDPDEALRIKSGDLQPRVIVEVELSNRDPLPLAKHVYRLIKKWAHLRCVIGLKIYKRPSKGGLSPESALCGKRSTMTTPSMLNGSLISVQKRARCYRAIRLPISGKRRMSTSARSRQKMEIPSKVKQLPTKLEDVSQILDKHFTITIHQSLLYHGHRKEKKQGRRKKLKLLAPLQGDADLQLDLFEVLTSIDLFKSKNFTEE